MSRDQQRSLQVFVSYAHEDEELCDELRKHLGILEREGKIRLWHDRGIGMGEEWAEEIDRRLSSADLILLLISPDFMASKYCCEIELPRALARHESGNARVVPIVLRPADWSHSPIARLQVLPRDARPVTSWPNRDEAFLDVQLGVRAGVERMLRQSPKRDQVQEHGQHQADNRKPGRSASHRPAESSGRTPRAARRSGQSARPQVPKVAGPKVRSVKPMWLGIAAIAVALALFMVYAATRGSSEPDSGSIAIRARYSNLTLPNRDPLRGHELRIEGSVDVYAVDGRSERRIGRWRKNTRVRVVERLSGTAKGGMWLKCQRLE